MSEPLQLRATTASRNADVKDAVHTLFTSLSTDPDPVIFMPATQRISYNKYKAAIVPTNGGVIIARKAKPGELYSAPELKWKPSRAEWLLRIILEHVQPPRLVNDYNRLEAIRIGQTRNKLWRTIEHIRRQELLEQGKRPIRQPDRVSECRKYGAEMTPNQERIYLTHYFRWLKAAAEPDADEMLWTKNRLQELEARDGK